MGGSIIQLIATGIDTVYLNGDPSITMFKCVYSRHTNFTITQSNCLIQNVSKFDSFGRYSIEKKGDCVSSMILRVDIGNFDVQYKTPIVINIKDILETYGILWTTTLAPDFIITQDYYNRILKPLIYDSISSYTTLYNNNFRMYSDILRGMDNYNAYNDDMRQQIIKTMNELKTDSAFFAEKNQIELLLDNLNSNLTSNNYIERFIDTNAYIITRTLDASGVPTETANDIITNITQRNNYYLDTSSNNIYQNNYNQILYDYGYGMFLLKGIAEYVRDSSGNRIEKLYDISGDEYVYDSSGHLIPKNSNLSPKTQILSRMYDVIKDYRLDIYQTHVDISTITFVDPLYIRDRMYDSYLSKLLDIKYEDTFTNNGNLGLLGYVTDFSGNASMTGSLDFNGIFELSGNLTLNNNLKIESIADLSGVADLSGYLILHGHNIDIHNITNLECIIDFSGNLNMYYPYGTLQFTGTSIDSSGNTINLNNISRYNDFINMTGTIDYSGNIAMDWSAIDGSFNYIGNAYDIYGTQTNLISLKQYNDYIDLSGTIVRTGILKFDWSNATSFTFTGIAKDIFNNNINFSNIQQYNDYISINSDVDYSGFMILSNTTATYDFSGTCLDYNGNPINFNTLTTYNNYISLSGNLIYTGTFNTNWNSGYFTITTQPLDIYGNSLDMSNLNRYNDYINLNGTINYTGNIRLNWYNNPLNFSGDAYDENTHIVDFTNIKRFNDYLHMNGNIVLIGMLHMDWDESYVPFTGTAIDINNNPINFAQIAYYNDYIEMHGAFNLNNANYMNITNTTSTQGINLSGNINSNNITIVSTDYGTINYDGYIDYSGTINTHHSVYSNTMFIYNGDFDFSGYIYSMTGQIDFMGNAIINGGLYFYGIIDTDTVALYRNLKNVFILYILINQMKIPTAIGYLDKKFNDYFYDILYSYYNNTNYPILNAQVNDYKSYDTYICLFKYLSSLSDNVIYDDTTIDTIKNNIVTTMYDNLENNYTLYNIIVRIMMNAYFSNSEHFRFGVYNTYTAYVSTNYQADSRILTVIQPDTLDLLDNLIDNINTVLNTNIFFKNDLVSYFNNYIINLSKTVQSNLYNDYLNDQSLWSFLSFNDTKFKTLLQSLTYGGENVYTLLEIGFSQNTLERLAIMNYLPIYLINDVPLAVNANIQNLSLLTENQLKYLDLSSNTFVGDVSSNFDISFNKQKLYNTILQNVVFSDASGTVIADADFINTYVANYLINSNKFGLFRIVRPEKSYPFAVGDKVYFIPNTRAVIEEYRREYYIRLNYLVVNGNPLDLSENHLDPSVAIAAFKQICVVLDNYIRFDFDNAFDNSTIDYSNYTNYITQKNKYTYNLYSDASGNPYTNITVLNNATTKFIYAQSSIYCSLSKESTQFYNNFMNDIALSNDYYSTKLGFSMYDLYEKFNITLPTTFVPGQFGVNYEYFSYDASNNITIKQFDMSANIYPRINLNYDISFNSATVRNLDYYIYNDTGLNLSIPVQSSGYDFNDFQNIISQNKMSQMVYYSGFDTGLVSKSTNLQNELTIFTNQYNDLKYLLSIESYYGSDLSFNTVSTTIDYYNNYFLSNPEVVVTEDISNNVIAFTKNLLVNAYKMCGDVLDVSTNNFYMADWSLLDIFTKFTEITNPFDIGFNPNLYDCYIYNSAYGYDMLTLYNELIVDVSILLYRDPHKIDIYNNYANKLDLLNYFLNLLITNSDGNYLLQYNQKNIDDYNAYVLAYIDNKKTEYYNILNKLLYYNNGIINYLPTNTEINYINQRLMPYFPLLNLIPNSLIYEQSELDILLNSMVSNIAPSYSWVRQLGYYMCDYIQLELNHEVFEKHNPQLLSLQQKLFIDNTKLRGQNYLIGDRPELYIYNNKNKSNITIYLPLNFWFTKNTTFNSLPLTNILYSDVAIAFKLKKLEDLLTMAPNSFISKEPKIKCSFITDYVYLEQEERLRIAASKLEFLVDRYMYGGLYTYKYADVINKTISTKLYMSDPSKFILWRVKIQTNDKLNWNRNGYTIVKYKTYNYVVQHPYTQLVTNYPYDVDIPVVEKARINFNGNLRQEGTYQYFNTVIPYECDLRSLEKGEMIYSFSLYPKLLQPSGTANFSVLEDVSIDNVLTDTILDYMKNDDLVLEVEYWTLSYQVMRLFSGFIAPAFISIR